MLALIFLVVLTTIVILGVIGHSEDNKIAKVSAIVLGVLLFIGGGIWYYTNTEAGKRAMKNLDSNINGGIEREVSVYDVDGDMIAHYEGKFDVDYDSDRIIFDDENGKRHIIYYPTGTIIIDEK